MDGVSPYFDVVILADMTIFFLIKYTVSISKEKRKVYTSLLKFEETLAIIHLIFI